MIKLSSLVHPPVIDELLLYTDLLLTLFISMKVTDSSVIRFHLQVLHGITVKSFEGRKDRLFISGAKIFGVPLENLPRRYIPEFGLVPW